MRKSLYGVICAAMLLPAGLRAGDRGALVYPVPEEVQTNDDFLLYVRRDGGVWKEVPCIAVPVDEVIAGAHHNELSSFAIFDFDGKLEVMAVSRRQKVLSARVRPLSYGIGARTSGDTVSFSLNRPVNISLEVNGDIFHNLQIFAGPVEKAPKRCCPKGLIRFSPGYHKLEGGVMDIPSGSTVIVEGGAWVDGTLRVRDAEDVRICGRGIVRPKRGYGVEVMRSRNVEVDGITLTQCPVGGSDGVVIRNVKSITNYGWGDGMNVFASSNVLFDGVFCRNSDDCTTVYATRKGYVGGCRNIEMRNSVLWADVAHPVFIGLHGAASYKREVGGRGGLPAEEQDAIVMRKDTIEHLSYRNIDILDQAEKQIDYQGCMAIACGDNNVVRDVLFEDIRVEDIRCGQLFFVRVFHNTKYCEAPGTCIDGVTFRNVSYDGGRAEMSHVEGYSPERTVSNIRFENLTINGTHIHDDMPGKPKWYKTADFARIFVGNHVSNLSFK